MTTIADDDDRAFLGHPKALAFLAFTEAWERFSYYGMQSLLVLYMTKSCCCRRHVEQIAGFCRRSTPSSRRSTTRASRP